MILNLIFKNYNYLLHTIPLFVYVFHIIFRDAENPLIDKFLKTGLKGMGICILYLVINCIQGTPFQNVIPFTWAYSGPITWGIFFFIFFYVLNEKEENALTSFTLAMLAAVGGGWLYEVSFFHPLSMFLGNTSFFYMNLQTMCLLLLFFEHRKPVFAPNPLIYIILISSMSLCLAGFPWINSQIICLLLLGYELRKRNFKPNKIIYATTFLFMAFSMTLFMNKLSIHQLVRNIFNVLNVRWSYVHAQNLGWIYRIPASLFLLSLLSGITKKNEMMKNV